MGLICHAKLKFNLEIINRLVSMWLEARDNLRKSDGFPGLKTLSMANHSQLLTILGTNIEMTPNFQRYSLLGYISYLIIISKLCKIWLFLTVFTP